MEEENPGEFKRGTVLGLGLIGGSLALAMEQFYPQLSLKGVDYEPQLERARERLSLDGLLTPDRLEEALAGSELVFLAPPIEEILRLVEELPPLVEEGTLVCDVGSTKRRICERAWSSFASCSAHFVGGHPMAGAETSGLRGAHPLLFENSVFVLTPPEGEEGPQERRLSGFLNGLGARTRYLAPAVHDEIVARISHLPQLVALSMVNFLEKSGGESPEKVLSFAGGGFRDMTRIASSPFSIWEDILATNGPAVREVGQELLRELQETLDAVGEERMKKFFGRSNQLRRKVPKTTKGLTTTTHKVAVMVPDRPGALASLTGALAEEEINIKDLELCKVREDYGGTFHVHFSSRGIAQEATELLEREGYEARLID